VTSLIAKRSLRLGTQILVLSLIFYSFCIYYSNDVEINVVIKGVELNMRRILLTALFVIGCAGLTTIQAQEKKLERKDLPKAVEKTVAKESVGAEIKGFATEKEDGIQTYEVELVVNGLTKDIAMDAKGNILEVEQEVAMDSLSEDVKAGLKASAGTGTITKVESLTKKGKLLAYEAAVTDGKKHREIQVGPDGKKLAKEQ
jgi:hypothetical protein